MALRPESPGAHLNLGNALYGKGQLDEAIACWRQAIALDPKYANAHSHPYQSGPRMKGTKSDWRVYSR